MYASSVLLIYLLSCWRAEVSLQVVPLGKCIVSRRDTTSDLPSCRVGPVARGMDSRRAMAYCLFLAPYLVSFPHTIPCLRDLTLHDRRSNCLLSQQPPHAVPSKHWQESNNSPIIISIIWHSKPRYPSGLSASPDSGRLESSHVGWSQLSLSLLTLLS